MAGDLRGFALHKAELLSSRLKEMLSSGQGYLRTRFGVDLGLEPELYPTWIILSTAAAGLLLLLAASWAAVCGGLLAGKRRRSAASRGGGGCEPVKANLTKTAKAEEQKKKNKKKAPEKSSQSNGQPVSVAQEDVKVAEVDAKLPQQIKPEKVQEVQAPAQAKKSKKKTKTDVKPVQHVVTDDWKEPDDGAWETKVSNREKKQQRRKEKGPEDSGSPGRVEAPKTSTEAPGAPASTKKNRNHESVLSRPTEKGDATSGTVLSGWREELSVNGGGWTEISVKMPGQMGDMEGTKWSATVRTASHYRAPPKRQSWAQERQAWSGIDGQIKADLNPVSFSMLGRNTAEPVSNSVELQWGREPNVDDEWSGFNGMAAADPSSDWNAPAEHWGNYDEVVAVPAPPSKEQPVTNKASEDEKDTEDPSSGAAKSKKRRKKKKKTEEEGAPESQAAGVAPQEPPTLSSKKQQSSSISSSSSSQKKPEPVAEPPKPSQKKKVRRET